VLYRGVNVADKSNETSEEERIPGEGEVLLELGPQFAWHSRVHTPESHKDMAYRQAEAKQEQIR